MQRLLRKAIFGLKLDFNFMKKKTLHFYSYIFKDAEILRGLISDEKIEILKKSLEPEGFCEARLENGKVISNFVAHKDTGLLFHKCNFEEGTYTIKEIHFYVLANDIWIGLLTDEEIDILNQKASSVWSARQDQLRFEKAQKIPAADYDGWVYSDCFDDYFDCVESFLERLEECDEDFVRPTFVWACNEKQFLQLPSAEDIVDDYAENRHEDWDSSQADGLKELDEAISKFNEANKDAVAYWADYSRAVILD